MKKVRKKVTRVPEHNMELWRLSYPEFSRTLKKALPEQAELLVEAWESDEVEYLKYHTDNLERLLACMKRHVKENLWRNL